MPGGRPRARLPAPIQHYLDSHPGARRRLVGARACGVAALAAVNLALVTWYVCVVYAGLLHSDAAMVNLLAREIVDTGRYFPPEWNYVNSDLWVLFGHTWIVPLLAFFPNSFALHAASGMVSVALILLGLWWLTGVLGATTWVRTACVAILFAGMSGVMADNLFGQVSYGTTFYITCFILVAGWRFLQGQGAPRWAWAGLLALLVALSFWSNPQRSTVYYGLPLFVAALAHGAAEWREGWRDEQVRRAGGLVAVYLVAAIVGTILHVWIAKSVKIVGGAGTGTYYIPVTEMARNAGLSFMGLIAFLGGHPTVHRPVVSPVGLYEAVRLVAALVVLCLVPWGLARALRDAEKGVRFVGVFTLVVAATAIFFQLATSVPQMVDPVQSTRYLVPALLLGMLLLVVRIARGEGRRTTRLAATLAFAVLATSAYPSLVKSAPGNNSRLGTDQPPPDLHGRLAKFLIANGLEYGYATYWTAGATTVRGEEKVRVRPVLIVNRLPVPLRHLSSNAWYRPQAWTGPTFLVLDPPEVPLVDFDALARHHGPPLRTLQFEGMRIDVYGRNLGIGLPGWEP